MLKSVKVCGPVIAVAVAMSMTAFGQVAVDPNLPVYQPTSGVSGAIKSVGSDTMNNLMTLWAEGFQSIYPNVTVEIEGKGSSTAPPALIAGSSTFGPMSRAMKSAEQDAFKSRFGYEAVQLPTSIDMLAVYVNKDNPIKGLKMAEIDAIFSSTRKLGHAEDVTKWGQVGLTGPWSNAPISLYGRNAASGTYGYFKKIAMGKGDYKNAVKEQPGSSSVVQGVAREKFAIGYSGIGYKTADVKAVAIDGTPATPEHAYDGSYALSRPLLLSVNYKPGSQLDPLRAEFIKYVFSKQGQEVVVKDGYFPVTAGVAKSALEQIGLSNK